MRDLRGVVLVLVVERDYQRHTRRGAGVATKSVVVCSGPRRVDRPAERSRHADPFQAPGRAKQDVAHVGVFGAGASEDMGGIGTFGRASVRTPSEAPRAESPADSGADILAGLGGWGGAAPKIRLPKSCNGYVT